MIRNLMDCGKRCVILAVEARMFLLILQINCHI